MDNQRSILKVEKYLYRLRSKENNIDNYYNKEMRNLTIGSKIIYLVSICKLFETNEQRNIKRGGKGLYSKPIENVDVNKLTKRDINEFLKSEWFNKLTNHTKNQHLIRIKKYLKFSNREDLVEELGGLLFKEEKRFLSKNDEVNNFFKLIFPFITKEVNPNSKFRLDLRNKKFYEFIIYNNKLSLVKFNREEFMSAKEYNDRKNIIVDKKRLKSFFKDLIDKSKNPGTDYMDYISKKKIDESFQNIANMIGNNSFI